MRLAAIFAILLVTLANFVSADVFKFGKVELKRENNSPGNWTQLEFKITDPKIGWRGYRGKREIFITLDTSFRNVTRTDIGFFDGWLEKRFYASTSKQWMHVGRSPLNGQQQQDVSRLSQNEKITAAWIIANASELIRFALYDSSTPIPAKSRNQWAKMLQDERFEKRVRKNLSPHFRSQLRMYDTYSRHTKLSLERAIQPQLERLGFYRGKIDGLWGPKTKKAIQDFERKNNLFPDGVNYDADRKLLSELAFKPKQPVETASDPKIRQLQDELSKLELILKARENYIERLKKEISSLKESDLSGKLERAELRADQLQDLSSKRFTQLIELRKEVKKSSTQITNLQNEIYGRNSDIKRLQQELAAARENQADSAEIDRLTRLTSNQRERIKKMSVTISDKNREIAKMGEAMDELRLADEEISTVKQKLQRQLEINSEQEAQIATLLSKNKEYKNISTQFEDKINALETEIASLKNGNGSKGSFELSDEWLDVEPYLAVQQVRFCQILSNYEEEAEIAAESRNQLRQNMVATNRDNDIGALIPNGEYKDWVAKVVEVYATPSGDAAFVLRMPCEVTFGSGRLPSSGDLDGEYAATAEYGGIIYNQLAQLAQGDTVLISGKILTYSDLGALNSRLRFVTTLIDKTKVKSETMKPGNVPDYFSSISYLSKL